MAQEGAGNERNSPKRRTSKAAINLPTGGKRVPSGGNRVPSGANLVPGAPTRVPSGPNRVPSGGVALPGRPPSGGHRLPQRPTSGANRIPAKPPIGERTPAKPPSGGSRPPGRGSGGVPQVPAPMPQGERGAEIGRFRMLGMSIATKFGLAISLLVIGTAVIFGFFMVRLFERNLRNDVIQYGYGQTVAFREICREVHQDYVLWANNQGEEKPYFHMTRLGQEHAARLKRVLDAEPRIHAAVVYVSRVPVRDPSDAVVWTGEERPLVYTRPAGVDRVDLAGSDPSIVYWFGTYNGEPALFFRAPLAGSGDNLSAVVQAVFVSKEIQAETNGLVWKVGAVAAALSVIGLLMALLLARAVTLPIHALVGDLDAIAKGDLDHEPVVQSRDEIGLLARAMARMTRALREKRDQDRHLERINADLSLAQEVVANLLPKKRVSLPGYDIDLAYRCAREIGGDYYDFIPIDNEHLALVVADVSGKGIAASMILATTRTLLRMMAPLNLSPADVLSKVNYHLHRDVKRGMFVTAVYGLLNVRTRQFRVASAGHNAMLVWRGKKKAIEALRPQGMALGFDRGPGFDRYVREMEIQLEAGDRVVLYTDGVVEAMNAHKEEWGMETFEKFAAQYADRPSAEFVNDLLMELDRHKGDAEQHDDITVVTMRIL